MKKILVINSSPNGEKSISRALVNEIKKEIINKLSSDVDFIEHDVAKEAIPHFDENAIMAAYTPHELRTVELNKAIELSDKLTNELLNSDVIIIGAPMWNLSIPSSLKAWIDNIVRVGLTFKYN